MPWQFVRNRFGSFTVLLTLNESSPGSQAKRWIIRRPRNGTYMKDEFTAQEVLAPKRECLLRLFKYISPLPYGGHLFHACEPINHALKGRLQNQLNMLYLVAVEHSTLE